MLRTDAFVRLALSVALAVVAALGAAAGARADDPTRPACPSVPAAIDESDPTAEPADVEARELRRTIVADCRARAWEADRAHGLAVTAHDDDRAAAAKLDRLIELGEDQADDPDGSKDHPVHVSSVDEREPVTGTVSLSGDDRDMFAAGFNDGNTRSWFFFGCFLAVLCLTGFVWASRPDR